MKFLEDRLESVEAEAREAVGPGKKHKKYKPGPADLLSVSSDDDSDLSDLSSVDFETPNVKPKPSVTFQSGESRKGTVCVFQARGNDRYIRTQTCCALWVIVQFDFRPRD